MITFVKKENMSVDFYEQNPNQPETNKQKKLSYTPILDNFSRDLTKLALNGNIDPVIGRDTEVKRIAQILSRKKKNNVVIVGEAGVGKSALIEKLALLINKGECPTNLIDKRIVSLDMASLVAGSKYRGQFEERMKAIINELQHVKNVVVFIDEMHTMVGAGNGSGALDAANILKPALARGEIQCIGATTFDEYKKNIEKDAALSRRFQKIILSEPTELETIDILNQIKSSYENYHNVIYNEGVIESIVKLSKKFITDRQFPDKAIDVMDELGSEKRISNKLPDSLEIIKSQLDEIKNKKSDVVKKQNFEIAAELRDQEQTLLKKYETEKQKWFEYEQNNKKPITLDDVYNIITNMTGVPITKLDNGETSKLLELENILSSKIIGQDDAISVISKCIRRNRVGIKDGGKPIGSFIFLGSTGVGKTLLAKSVAEVLFGDKDKVIRIDMSEYMEKFNVARLIGAPPGYVGYEEGGTLTEKIKNNPFSVILFDEIEKAHKDVFNILLQILDEGHLTDSFGRKVNFTNTIIIMTSNVGARKVSEFGNGIGFTTNNSEKNKENLKKTIIKSALKQQFNPEFLNRIDDIILFNSLSKDDLKRIVKIEVDKLQTRLLDKNYQVTFDETIINRIIELNEQEEYGARPIKRIIQNLCEDFLSEEILKGNIIENKKSVLKFIDGSPQITKK